MITAQAENLAKRPDFRMTAIRADLALSRYRWLVERMLAEEAKAARGAAGDSRRIGRRPTPERRRGNARSGRGPGRRR